MSDGKKYLLIGGHVYRHDGDVHYVGPDKLVYLYGLKRSECFFAHDEDDARAKFSHIDRLIHLGVRQDGDYEHPDNWGYTPEK